MSFKEIDAHAIAVIAEYCYMHSLGGSLTEDQQDKYKVLADRLNIYHRLVVSKQFDEATAEYKKASKALEDAVNSINASTAALDKAVAMLGTVEQVIKILEELLSKVVFV